MKVECPTDVKILSPFFKLLKGGDPTSRDENGKLFKENSALEGKLAFNERANGLVGLGGESDRTVPDNLEGPSLIHAASETSLNLSRELVLICYFNNAI